MRRLKNWLRLLVIAAATLAPSVLPAPAQCLPCQAAFDAAYVAAQPPQVAALLTDNKAAADAMSLATQGFVIDVPIDVYHWDACLVMALRQQSGYTWVPSALQPPVLVAPGITFNGQQYDPNNPPPGSVE